MERAETILEQDDVEKEDTEGSSEDSIKEPFDPKKIDVTTKQMIIEVILRRLRNNEIDLNTSFQRGMDLWDKTKQSRLIESILIKLPLPAFYFASTNDNQWLIVDGLQRISTFKNYVIEKNFKLQHLEYLSKFNDKTFDELPQELQRRIEEHEITVYIINPGTPPEVKFNLFRRINTGGLTLTAQEIRHAINPGIPANFIIELAELDEFKKFKINTKRMLDRDFITRFIAFYLHKTQEYKPDLDSFLNDSMSKLKQLSTREREQIKANFQKALLAAWKIFDNDAFRKRYDINDNRKPMNKALFEVWTVTLSKYEIDLKLWI
ncbi:MAG TPA: DUF262 domain-containing protein [Thermodesulfovibrionia bacterium]|nr:DUF262 domain-containing protein [Thermodesulfovibrionia bacterium]